MSLPSEETQIKETYDLQSIGDSLRTVIIDGRLFD